jgi:hypothetical protein
MSVVDVERGAHRTARIVAPAVLNWNGNTTTACEYLIPAKVIRPGQVTVVEQVVHAPRRNGTTVALFRLSEMGMGLIPRPVPR